MEVTCGNCKIADCEKGNMVRCKPDLLPAEWHLKSDPRSVCKYFVPIHVDLHIVLEELIAEYYAKDPKPICTIACGQGKRFLVDSGHIMQVRIAGWSKEDYFYDESENRYRRETWSPPKLVPCVRELTVVVNTGNQIG